MTTRIAHQASRSTHGLAWAMTCVALALGTSAASAQTPPARAPAAAQAAAPVLNRAQIDALLATPDKVLVLDVRRADEISSIGGFPAYLNIQAAELEQFLPFVPRDRKIVTVSNHAARAIRAGALLASRGFQVAGAAGAQDYEAQGGRLVGRKAVPAAAAAADAPRAEGVAALNRGPGQ
jgi:gluconolactonase